MHEHGCAINALSVPVASALDKNRFLEHPANAEIISNVSWFLLIFWTLSLWRTGYANVK